MQPPSEPRFTDRRWRPGRAARRLDRRSSWSGCRSNGWWVIS